MGRKIEARILPPRDEWRGLEVKAYSDQIVLRTVDGDVVMTVECAESLSQDLAKAVEAARAAVAKRR